MTALTRAAGRRVRAARARQRVLPGPIITGIWDDVDEAGARRVGGHDDAGAQRPARGGRRRRSASWSRTTRPTSVGRGARGGRRLEHHQAHAAAAAVADADELTATVADDELV